jgi:hypothetical protein
LVNGGLDLGALPEIAEPLKAGLRAGGALVRVGLDPEAFEIDRSLRHSPFPGLESFGDEDADAAIFYGRSPEIARCLEDLREMRANGVRQPYIILGASGSGKSSLMKAGVLPRLRREHGWVVLRALRPGADPLFNFAGSIAQTFTDHGEVRAPGEIRDDLYRAWQEAPKVESFSSQTGLLHLYERLELFFSKLRERAGRPHATMLIPLDQGEEISRAEGESADALSDYLRAALVNSAFQQDTEQGDTRALVCLTVRTDSFPELQKSRRFAGLDARCADIRPLPLYRFDAVIEGPASRYGVQIETGLVEMMIDEEPGDDVLPILAFALQRLWRQYNAAGRLRRADYETLGKLSAVIDDASERALRDLRPEEDSPLQAQVPSETETLVAKIFVPSLVQIGDSGATIRRVAPIEHFDSKAMRLLESFMRWRLLVKKPGAVPSAATIEVAHESIFRFWRRLQKWIDQEKSRMQVLRDLENTARHWEGRNCAPSYLDHKGRRLKEARAVVAIPDFAKAIGNTETAYLKACGAAQTKRRLMTVVSGAILMIAVFIAANLFEAAALRASMQSAAQKLVQEGLPTQAAQFAIAGTVGETEMSALANVSDAQGSLRDTGFTLKLLFNLPQPHVANDYRISKDGTRLVTQTVDNSGAIWDVDRATKLADLGPNGSVKAFVITADDARLITQSSDHAFAIWDLRSGARIGGSGATTYAKATLASSIARLVTLSESSTATLWNVQTGTQIGTTLGEPNEIEDWRISANPPRIVTRSRQKAGQLWDAATGQAITDLGGPGSCEWCSFSEGGSRLMTVQTAGYGLLLDANDASLIGKVDAGSRIAGYAFNSDGTRLITRTIYNKLVHCHAEIFC